MDTILLITLGWILCGLAGLALWIAIANKGGDPIIPSDVVLVMWGPFMLLTGLATCIQMAVGERAAGEKRDGK